MADAWNGAWGSSWGNSWGAGVAPPVVAPPPATTGGWGFFPVPSELRRNKKERKVERRVYAAVVREIRREQWFRDEPATGKQQVLTFLSREIAEEVAPRIVDQEFNDHVTASAIYHLIRAARERYENEEDEWLLMLSAV